MLYYMLIVAIVIVLLVFITVLIGLAYRFSGISDRNKTRVQEDKIG